MAPRSLLLPLLPLLALSASCSGPEDLTIGPASLPYAAVEEAVEELAQAFPQFAPATLQGHLLEHGMGLATVLHHALPEESAAARAEAQAWADAVAAGEPFLDAFARWNEGRVPPARNDGLAQPNPATLGARVAAAVATMEPGDWRGPLRTAQGWELVHLAARSPGVRHRANVDLYRIVVLVGDEAARDQASRDWATLPLSGNRELILALPLEFRRGRTTDQP